MLLRCPEHETLDPSCPHCEEAERSAREEADLARRFAEEGADSTIHEDSDALPAPADVQEDDAPAEPAGDPAATADPSPAAAAPPAIPERGDPTRSFRIVRCGACLALVRTQRKAGDELPCPSCKQSWTIPDDGVIHEARAGLVRDQRSLELATRERELELEAKRLQLERERLDLDRQRLELERAGTSSSASAVAAAYVETQIPSETGGAASPASQPESPASEVPASSEAASVAWGSASSLEDAPAPKAKPVAPKRRTSERRAVLGGGSAKSSARVRGVGRGAAGTSDRLRARKSDGAIGAANRSGRPSERMRAARRSGERRVPSGRVPVRSSGRIRTDAMAASGVRTDGNQLLIAIAVSVGLIATAIVVAVLVSNAGGPRVPTGGTSLVAGNDDPATPTAGDEGAGTGVDDDPWPTDDERPSFPPEGGPLEEGPPEGEGDEPGAEDSGASDPDAGPDPEPGVGAEDPAPAAGAGAGTATPSMPVAPNPARAIVAELLDSARALATPTANLDDLRAAEGKLRQAAGAAVADGELDALALEVQRRVDERRRAIAVELAQEARELVAESRHADAMAKIVAIDALKQPVPAYVEELRATCTRVLDEERAAEERRRAEAAAAAAAAGEKRRPEGLAVAEVHRRIDASFARKESPDLTELQWQAEHDAFRERLANEKVVDEGSVVEIQTEGGARVTVAVGEAWVTIHVSGLSEEERERFARGRAVWFDGIVKRWRRNRRGEILLEVEGELHGVPKDDD